MSTPYVELLEPGVVRSLATDAVPAVEIALSQAISLKRIADALEQIAVAGGIGGLLDQIAQHPMNQYGEGFADAIQNGIARGLRGMNTNDR